MKSYAVTKLELAVEDVKQQEENYEAIIWLLLSKLGGSAEVPDGTFDVFDAGRQIVVRSRTDRQSTIWSAKRLK